jgi:membrane-associated phospholipid phosphatase
MFLFLVVILAGPEGELPGPAVAGPQALADPEAGEPDPFEEALARELRLGARPRDESAPSWANLQEPAGGGGFQGPHDSFPGFFNSHFSSKAWRFYVWEDYLTQPAILIPLGMGVAAAIVSHWDKPWEKKLRNSITGSETLSDVTLYTLIGGALLSGALFPGDGRNTWDELFTQGEGFGATALTTATIKEFTHRPRPFSGGGSAKSFPSGHTSASFCAATLIERNFGIEAGIPAYAVAALCGYARVSAARHYPSDVMAGAAIGILSARIFDGLHWGVDGKGGIARPGWDLRVTMEDRRHGLLELALAF